MTDRMEKKVMWNVSDLHYRAKKCTEAGEKSSQQMKKEDLDI